MLLDVARTMQRDESYDISEERIRSALSVKSSRYTTFRNFNLDLFSL